MPFAERASEYWGPPADDESAIAEVKRQREASVDFIVIGWPAFWWLDCYAAWHDWLRREFPCLLENENVCVFKLT